MVRSSEPQDRPQRKLILRVDNAAKLDENFVSGAFDDVAVVHCDSRIDQIAAQRPQPRQRAFFVRAGEPTITGHIGD
jgi:hypothetical protein